MGDPFRERVGDAAWGTDNTRRNPLPSTQARSEHVFHMSTLLRVRVGGGARVGGDYRGERRALGHQPGRDAGWPTRRCVRDFGRRTVTLPRRLVFELNQHRRAYLSPALVFTSPQRNQVCSGNLRRRYWTPAVTRDGLDGAFHAMRRTAMSLWSAAGGSDFEVAKWAGHSSRPPPRAFTPTFPGTRRGAGRPAGGVHRRFNARPDRLRWCTSADPDVH